MHPKEVLKFVVTNPANEGARTRALIRLLRFQARARFLRKRTLAPLGERSRMWVDLHRWEASKVVYANPPDYAEMTVWRNTLQPGDLFMDVGANVGSYSILAGELGAEVMALEPAEDTFELLTENLHLNGYEVQPIRAAAGATCGTARFTTGLDSGNHIHPDGTASTEVVTVDSLVGDRKVAGMKVDVEGYEIDVLRGCERALSEQRIGLIQLEWNHTVAAATGTDRRPVADLLGGHGYRLFRPERDGDLTPLTDLGFGPDVFARPG